MSDWREVIKRAGGPDAAIIWGAPLKSMIAEIDALPAKLEDAESRARKAMASAIEADEQRAAAQELLRIEREAMIAIRARNDQIALRLRDLEHKVEMYEWYEPSLVKHAAEAWDRAHPKEPV